MRKIINVFDTLSNYANQWITHNYEQLTARL